MPQVDLETLLCGGDVKISCETMIGGENPAAKAADEDPDMPAESFQIRIGEDIDWADINAFYERDDSTKGNTNPKSQHGNQKQQPLSNSQRYSGNLKPKAPIIALPNKMQPSSYLGVSARRLPNGRMFSKKKPSDVGLKSAVPPPEPGSPKVSCFGKVLSDGDRKKFRHQHHQPQSAPSISSHAERRQPGSGGWLARLAGIFLCDRPVSRQHESDEEASTPPEKIVPWSGRLSSATVTAGDPIVTPAGLGAMRRFSSGRRPASWGEEQDSDEIMHVALSAPLDQEGAVGMRSIE
ncbi:hypothetical protein KSP39_PZI011452 [Platanthera zijinensis]|uniref:Uncharacterized protein n=1 Tax=Platanthera zijinensis TaxID=2320716 RepID=A0AAP0BJ90_9ASPA